MTDFQADAAVTSAAWVEDVDALRAWFEPVAADDVVGLDTEFTRRDTFYSQLSLLQLGHRGRHALVDPLAFDLADVLREQLHRPGITCVMHSAGEDLETLAPWLPGGPANLFDTQVAAAFAGLGHGVGYRALVANLCGDELDKGETRSDWNRRPLSDSQKRYAVLDVVYLEDLHRQLRGRLASRQKLDWFHADCEQLKQRADADAFDDQPQRGLSSASEWSRERQAMLRRLLCWRERAARQWDKPRNWLLDNAHALDLVSHPPADAEALRQATRGLRALRSAQRAQLWEVLQGQPDAAEIAATRAIPGRLQGEAKEAVSAMKGAVADLADRLDLPSGLLCPRKHLETLVFDGQWPEALDGWRRELLQSHLMPLLPA